MCHYMNYIKKDKPQNPQLNGRCLVFNKECNTDFFLLTYFGYELCKCIQCTNTHTACIDEQTPLLEKNV